ncbi:MAG: hypothetical protein HYX27_14425 [Acidobacteria bacterium]|nr:hypothetical protein [Acidobacteriota bacterium]
MALLAVGLSAQTSSGSITGTLLDSTGQAIAGTLVKVISERTGEEGSATCWDLRELFGC